MLGFIRSSYIWWELYKLGRGGAVGSQTKSINVDSNLRNLRTWALLKTNKIEKSASPRKLFYNVQRKKVPKTE